MMFAGVTDIAMLFVRCGNGGISHSPREIITAEDADIAARVMLDAVLRACRSIHDASRRRRGIRRSAISRARPQFLAELVKVPSDNPPGDCAAHAAAGGSCWSSSASWSRRMRCRAPWSRRRHEERDQSHRPPPFRRRAGVALNAHGDVVPPGLGWRVDPYGATSRTARMVRSCTGAASRYRNRISPPIPGPCWRCRRQWARAHTLGGTLELHFTYDEEAGGDVGPKWLLDRD